MGCLVTRGGPTLDPPRTLTMEVSSSSHQFQPGNFHDQKITPCCQVAAGRSIGRWVAEKLVVNVGDGHGAVGTAKDILR